MAAFTAHVAINESNLQAHRDINIHAHMTSARLNPMEILKEYVAFGALHDSAERFDPPRCHPNTRITVLGWIDEWVHDSSDNVKPILWLTGAAGAGKSAIVQTKVEEWKMNGLFSANFFFWRTGDQRNDKTRLVATLAYQLANRYPEIKGLIERAVADTGVFQKNLRAQMEDLLVHPVANLPKEKLPVILVIDGLDECSVSLAYGQDHEQQQKEILEAVGQICRERPGKFKFLVASRPERQIREAYGGGSLPEEIYLQHSLNDAPDADADVELFLNSTFEETRRRHGIDPSWPSKAQVATLLAKSSGQFLYPSMAMKHICRPKTNPVDNLKAVLDLQPGSTNSAFADIDALYTYILSSVTEESRPVATNILRTILGPDNDWISKIFNDRPADASPLLLKHFLFLEQSDIYFHLSDLHSVLDIPSSSDPNRSIRLIHATFSEYLQDPLRSGDFSISKESIFHHWSLFGLRQLKECIQHKKRDIHIPILLATFTLWLSKCEPARDLMDILWGMMEDDIGPYPSLRFGSQLPSYEPGEFPNNIMTESGTVKLRVLVEEWNKRIKEIKIKMQDLCLIIDYLQKCNIPEIEPIWWRRYEIRRRLEIAFLRLRRGVTHVGPVSKYDIVLDTTRGLAPELRGYQHAMRHKFWIYLLIHLTSHFRI